MEKINLKQLVREIITEININETETPTKELLNALRDGLKRIDVGGGKLINVEYSKSGKMYILYYDNDITLYAPHNSSWYSIIYNIRKQYK